MMAEIPDDSILYNCNETELITMAQKTLGIRLRRGLPKADYVSIVGGYCDAHEGQLSATNQTRHQLQVTIAKKLEVMRSQLPGCNGKCTIYPCSDGRHSVCYSPNEETVKPW
jgi:hypothetical protein